MMKIEGEYTFNAPRDKVWELLQSPEALSHALPGVEEFGQVGPDEYEATVKVGVPAVRGTYHGRVKMVDLEPPKGYTLIASGQGGSGTIQATARITLTAEDSRTSVRYDADAQVGGVIAGVGQRMLGGVANLLAKQFFKAMEAQMTDQIGATVPPPTAPEHRSALQAISRANPRGPTDLRSLTDFMTPMVTTLLAGLVGCMVGRRARGSAGSGNRELAVAIHDLANAIRENRRR
jgi:carbon monoxide dehydrogenase subunit G